MSETNEFSDRASPSTAIPAMVSFSQHPELGHGGLLGSARAAVTPAAGSGSRITIRRNGYKHAPTGAPSVGDDPGRRGASSSGCAMTTSTLPVPPPAARVGNGGRVVSDTSTSARAATMQERALTRPRPFGDFEFADTFPSRGPSDVVASTSRPR